jgi:hypothetical protein
MDRTSFSAGHHAIFLRNVSSEEQSSSQNVQFELRCRVVVTDDTRDMAFPVVPVALVQDVSVGA